MKTLGFIILAFISIDLNAQDCAYEDYFYWIGRAQLDHRDKNYEKAEEYFKKAFQKNVFPLGQDLDFALELAILNKDSIWAQDLTIKLAKGGIPLIHFRKLEAYSWYSEFEERYHEYNTYYKSNFDEDLKFKLIEQIQLDSTFNAKYHNWADGNIELSVDDLISGARKVRDGFKNIIKEYGFPGQKKIGYHYNNSRVEPFATPILFIHIYQRGELMLINELSQIVCDGNLTPSAHAMIKGFKGFGDSTGIEQEMKIRYRRKRPQK